METLTRKVVELEKALRDKQDALSLLERNFKSLSAVFRKEKQANSELRDRLNQILGNKEEDVDASCNESDRVETRAVVPESETETKSIVFEQVKKPAKTLESELVLTKQLANMRTRSARLALELRTSQEKLKQVEGDRVKQVETWKKEREDKNRLREELQGEKEKAQLLYARIEALEEGIQAREKKLHRSQARKVGVDISNDSLGASLEPSPTNSATTFSLEDNASSLEELASTKLVILQLRKENAKLAHENRSLLAAIAKQRDKALKLEEQAKAPASEKALLDDLRFKVRTAEESNQHLKMELDRVLKVLETERAEGCDNLNRLSAQLARIESEKQTLLMFKDNLEKDWAEKCDKEKAMFRKLQLQTSNTIKQMSLEMENLKQREADALALASDYEKKIEESRKQQPAEDNEGVKLENDSNVQEKEALSKIFAADMSMKSHHTCLTCMELFQSPVMCSKCGENYCESCAHEKRSGRCVRCGQTTWIRNRALEAQTSQYCKRISQLQALVRVESESK